MERTEYVKQQGCTLIFLETLNLRHINRVDLEADGHGPQFSGRPRLCGNNVRHPLGNGVTHRNFINLVRDPKSTEDADDEFIDDAMPHVVLPVTLPLPTMATLDAIDHIVQQCVASNGAARESLVSHIHETVRSASLSN